MTLQDIQALYDQSLANLQSQIAGAARNMNVGSWGGSGADAAHWASVYNNLNSSLPILQQDYQKALNTINTLGIGNDPQALQLFQNYLQRPDGGLTSGVAGQQLQTYLNQQQQAQYQQQQYNQLIQQQQDAARAAQAQLLAQIPTYADQLNQSLIGAENTAMGQLRPQIEDRMQQLGLLQSGALPQAYAQSQTALDLARQNQLANFQQNAINQVGLGIPLNALQNQLGNLSSATGGNIQAMADANARNYALNDVANERAYQQSLQQQALYAARQNSQQPDNMMGQIIGGIGAAGSIIGAPFTGGMSLAGLPGSLGMIAGGGQGGQMGSSLGGLFGQMGQAGYRNYYGTGGSYGGGGNIFGGGRLNLSPY